MTGRLRCSSRQEMEHEDSNTRIGYLMNPDRINLIRALVSWTIRAIALIMTIVGLSLCLNRILFGLLCGQSFFGSAFQLRMEIGATHPMYRGLPLVILGVVLGILSKRLSCWIITVPSDSCPRCGYLRPMVDPPPGDGSSASSSSRKTTRCPECGLDNFINNDTHTR